MWRLSVILSVAIFSLRPVECTYSCPKGFASWGDYCYWMSNARYDFDTARQVCLNMQGDLLAYNTVEEKAFVEQMLAHKDFDMWFGLRQQNEADHSTWAWTDTSTPGPLDPTLTNWHCDQLPESGCSETAATGPCGFLVATKGTWKTNPCGNKKIFACRRSFSVVDNCDLPSGWYQYAGKCYKTYEELKGWDDARHSCTNEAGDLVMLKTAEEIEAFKHMQFCYDYQSAVWIGLSDKEAANENQVLWVDGTPSENTETNWAIDQPVYGNAKGENCAASYTIDSFMWRITHCASENRFMCQKSYGTCAEGWFQHGDTGHCYLMITSEEQKCTWFEAQDRCRAYGSTADLMKVSNAAEQEALTAMYTQLIGAAVDTVRIGVSDERTDNDYKWSDGTYLSFSHWDENLREQVPERVDCGYMPTTDQNPEARWGTDYCFDLEGYICRIAIFEHPLQYMQDYQDVYTEYGCPDGWVLNGQKCYLFLDSTMTYADTKTHCQTTYGGHVIMVKVLSADEQSFLSHHIAGKSWLGLVYENSVWVWDGTAEQPQFQNWAQDGKSLQGTNNCAMLQDNPVGQWYNAHCANEAHLGICEQAATVVTAPPSTEKPNTTTPWSEECGPSWSYDVHSQRCYAIRAGTLASWDTATTLCEEEGGSLLSITSESEQFYINSLLSSFVGGAASYWIGLNEKDPVKGWQWTDGEPVPYFNWNNGEPNNAGGQEHCVNLSPNNLYRWNDHACTWEADGYICEKMGASAVTTTTTTTMAPPVECVNEPLVSGTMYIADQAITARNFKEGREPYKARLNSDSSYQPTANDEHQWIDFEFPYQRGIDSVTMAGAKDVSEYVTTYRMAYETAPGMFYQFVYNADGAVYDFPGCDETTKNDGNTVALPHRIYATRVVIYPQAWTNAISMRVEFNGCPIAEDKCEAAASVSGDVRVLEEGMSANSFEPGYEANRARFSSTGWEALNPPTTEDYLQIEFQTTMRIFEIQTKGRKDENRFVKTFQMLYYDPENPDNTTWITYEEPHGTVKTFTANTNNLDMVSNPVKGEVLAKRVRIKPLDYEAGKAMRVEILACSPGCYPSHVISGETYSIPDSSLSASSTWDGNHGPSRSRLYTEADGDLRGAWSALVNDENQWIKADLGQVLQVRAVSTQGRSDYDQWVKKYKVQYSDNDEHWNEFVQTGDTEAKVFSTSWSRNELRTNNFEPSFKARYVRLHPTAWNAHISLRWDISACPGSYSYYSVGCWADSPEGRDLPYAAISGPQGGLTVDSCVHHCYTQGYLYAGAQYGNECYCGNDYGRYGKSSQCTMSCAGNDNQLCGGHYSNSVHSTGMSPSTLRCADGYEEFNDACFKFVKYTDSPFEWGEARYYCQQEGADLASIANKAENDFFTSKVAEMGQNAWIGLHSQAQDSGWEWSNYEPVEYTNWDRREPNNAGDEDCTLMYFSGENLGFWNDGLCAEKTHGGYVCRKGKEALAPPATPTADYGCGQGWLPFRWKCYHFITSIQSWDMHRTNCEAMAEGATLARIEDSSEQAFISSSVFGMGGIYWTDLNDKDSPGTYVYTDGTHPAFTYWAAGQPDQNTEATCVGLSDDDSGNWYDNLCGETYYAVCEKPSTTVTEPPSTVGTGASGECGDGWEEYGDYCYMVRVEESNMRLNWDKSREWCLAHNADLVSIHSENENQFLRTIIHPDKNINYWIGMSRTTHNDSFQWSDASEAEFFYWNDGQPSDSEDANCVNFDYAKGKWESAGCGNTKSYICKILRGQTVIIPSTEPYPTPDPNGDCSPDGDRWKFYNEKCYFFSDTDDEEKETWYDAEAWCHQHGAKLVSIHSDDEMRFIMGQTRDVGSQWTWIGLNTIDGSESWSDGTPVEYFYWADGEPNDSGGTEMCVGTETYRDNHGPWAHIHCSKAHVYICKKTPGNPTITTVLPTPAPGNCPEGYLPFLDKCYKFVDDEELMWEDARKACYEENKPYSLASIHNIQENAFLTAHLLERPHQYWIGLELLNVDQGLWAWVDNSPVTYTAWAAEEPNGGKEEKCAHLFNDMQRAGLWNDLNCDSPLRYICMTYKDVAYEAPPQEEPGLCAPYGMNAPYDYVEYNGDCFKVASGAHRTWQEGEDHCVADAPGKGHLASIRNIYEQSFIYTVFFYEKAGEIGPEENVWIGMTDSLNPGQFAWADTSSVTYTNWGDNQPDNPDGGCVYFQYTDSRWVDSSCEEKYKSICRINEKEIPVTQPPHAVNGTCPGTDIKDHNWLAYGVSCYLFIEDPVTFAEAHTFCLGLASDLVSIHSQEENDFVLAHITIPGAGYRFWTGMYRSVSEGFQWTNGKPVGFTNFAPGEPSDKNGTYGENFVEIYTYDGTWNDISDSQLNGVVCMTPAEMPIISTTPEPPPGPTETHPSHASTVTTMGPTPPPTAGTQPQPTTYKQNADNGGNDKEPLSSGDIVGIVFAVCAVILAVLIILLVVYKRRQVTADGLNNPLYQEGAGINTGHSGASTA